MHRLFFIVTLVYIFSCQQNQPAAKNNTDRNTDQNTDFQQNQTGTTGSTSEQDGIASNQSSQNCINYLNHIEPVMQNNCFPCHASGATPPDLTNSNNNSGFLSSSIANAILRGTMPPRSSGRELSSEQLSTVQAWQSTQFLKSSSDCPQVNSNGSTGSTTESGSSSTGSSTEPQPSVGSGSSGF